MKPKEFIKRLKRNGVEVVDDRGKGAHKWASYNGKSTTIPFHGSTDIDPIFLKEICKQLGIDPKDVI